MTNVQTYPWSQIFIFIYLPVTSQIRIVLSLMSLYSSLSLCLWVWIWSERQKRWSHRSPTISNLQKDGRRALSFDWRSNDWWLWCQTVQWGHTYNWKWLYDHPFPKSIESCELLTFQSVGWEIILLEIVLKRNEIKSYLGLKCLCCSGGLLQQKRKQS